MTEPMTPTTEPRCDDDFFCGECPDCLTGEPPENRLRYDLRDSVSAAHDHDCKEVADAQAASPLAEPWNEGERHG